MGAERKGGWSCPGKGQDGFLEDDDHPGRASACQMTLNAASVLCCLKPGRKEDQRQTNPLTRELSRRAKLKLTA